MFDDDDDDDDDHHNNNNNNNNNKKNADEADDNNENRQFLLTLIPSSSTLETLDHQGSTLTIDHADEKPWDFGLHLYLYSLCDVDHGWRSIGGAPNFSF